MDNKTAEGCLTLEDAFNNVGGLQDWYYEQVDAGLADPSKSFTPSNKLSDTVWEHLAADQAQADSLLAAALAIAEKVGCPLSGTIVDVNYTSETIPADFDFR